jgi:hypothetical protein
MATEGENTTEPDQNAWAEAYAQVTADPALRQRLQEGESPIDILESVRGDDPLLIGRAEFDRDYQDALIENAAYDAEPDYQALSEAMAKEPDFTGWTSEEILEWDEMENDEREQDDEDAADEEAESPARVDYETDIQERYAAAISATTDVLPRLETTPRHPLGEDYYQRQLFYRDRTAEPASDRLPSAQRASSFTQAERDAVRATLAPGENTASSARPQAQLTEGRTL